MSGLPWRLACSLVFFLPTLLHAQAVPALAWGRHTPNSAASVSSATLPEQHVELTRSGHGFSSRELPYPVPHLLSGGAPWQSVGPSQIHTTQFGDVTGRVTSIAIAPWDASGNTVYLGATGGGVWRSTNAAGDASSVIFTPLTDDLPAFSGVNIASISIGAVSVQPGNTPNGVVLAGTGDPNGATDSYYGAGILRSPDGGTTWTLVRQSSDGFAGGLTNYSFAGDAFSGFAWSTANTSLVVAAVTDSYDGFVNNINNSGTDNVAEAGLYYSTDAGQTWYLATIKDGPNQVIESPQTTLPSIFPGVPVSAVVWNPARQMFYAAVQYHGYYQSADGVTWMRLANQPGTALSATNCPANPGYTGSNSCAIFRGALAVQPATGDMFSWTVDANNVDQGIWQDVCNAGANGCAAPVSFGVPIDDAALEDTQGDGTIPQGTYDLTLTAVPSGTDTLLFAGAEDIFRCSLAAACAWRNTTNSATCASAQVASAQHAMTSLAAPAGGSGPLLYFGNDGGLWRSTDGVAETGAVCSSSDAQHFQNLNGGLGSLDEVTGLVDSSADANVLLAGFGVNGSAATTDMGATAWPQLLSETGGETAIDAVNPNNWYATLGTGVAIAQCTQGESCAAGDFGSQPVIGAAQVEGDDALLYAPYQLDPADSQNMIVGTCRVWRGPANGSGWSSANAISPMLDGHAQPSCSGNALIRSLAAGGANEQPGMGAQNAGSQVIYAGMAGLLDGGGSSVPGHVFSTQTANLANGTTAWTDLAYSPVANESSYGGVFNPEYFDVSAMYADPHDPTGETVYAAIQGFGVPHLYSSTNGGTSWTNITSNLPDLPLNDVLVDPNDASVVYAATDRGVYVTTNVTNCITSGTQCWNALGTGLPMSPAVKLAATLANGGYLRVGTYGRGIWQTPLLSSAPQTTISLSPGSLTFGSQLVGTDSSEETVTVTNTGSNSLQVGSVAVSGDFIETDNCGPPIVPGAACQIQVQFAPTATGTRSGTLAVSANVPGGGKSIPLSGTGTTASVLVLMPTSMDFGTQQVGTISANQQLTVSNTSGSSITLTSESVTGAFSIVTNTCASTLAANTGCTLAMAFVPMQAGPASGTLNVVSSQGNQTVSLSGNGATAATDTLSPLSLTFPATTENTASAPQTVTLSNTGGVALTGIQVQTFGDFAVSSSCGYSLNPNSSCVLTVEYTPHAAGAETGSILVTDSLRSQTVQLSGTGVAPPTDTLSSTVVSFPATVAGQSAPTQTVTLMNSGGGTLTGISVQFTGAAFSETNTCGSTLAVGSSCTLTLGFHPTAPGPATGQVVVTDALRTQAISLSGTGESPGEDNLSPLALAFGNQAVGSTSSAQSVTLSNNGPALLTEIQIQSSSADFPFTTTCGTTLPTGSSCGITVRFNPHAAGNEGASLSVKDALQTQNVALTGTGVLGNVTLAPTTLDFGIQGVQIASAAQTITLTNGSGLALSNLSIAVNGAFSQTNTCGASLTSGSSCSIAVVFLPASAGVQSGTLTVQAANLVPLNVTLSGTGIAFDLLPAGPTSATLSSGATANYALQLVPTNGSTGSASLTCTNVPPNSICIVTPSTATLLGPTNIQVAIATGFAVSSVRQKSEPRLAGLASGWLWLLGTLSAGILWRQRRSGRGMRMLVVLLAVCLLASVSACGIGGGPLGSESSNPLPGNGTTPSGTYTVTVMAAAGGLAKSVSLVLNVQ